MNIAQQHEETAKRLQGEGFEVQFEVKGASGATYDLVARRSGYAVVYEITSQLQLAVNAPTFSRLRQQARQDGYQDFRLIVVPEAPESFIQIEGLEGALLSWLQEHPEVRNNTLLEGHPVSFQRVDRVHIASLASRSGRIGTKVGGTAVVDFVIISHPDEVSWDCPFRFDVRLDVNWKVESVDLLFLDLLSIEEYLQDYLLEKVA